MKRQKYHNNYKRFVCTYNYGGKPYSIEITAKSFEEAQDRLKNIGSNGRVNGEFIAEIPIPLRERWVKKILNFLAVNNFSN